MFIFVKHWVHSCGAHPSFWVYIIELMKTAARNESNHSPLLQRHCEVKWEKTNYREERERERQRERGRERERNGSRFIVWRSNPKASVAWEMEETGRKTLARKTETKCSWDKVAQAQTWRLEGSSGCAMAECLGFMSHGLLMGSFDGSLHKRRHPWWQWWHIGKIFSHSLVRLDPIIFQKLRHSSVAGLWTGLYDNCVQILCQGAEIVLLQLMEHRSHIVKKQLICNFKFTFIFVCSVHVYTYIYI